MDDQELRPKRPAATHEIGQDLALLSIAELEERIVALRHEIVRLDTARNQKLAAQGAAQSAFKR